MANFQSPEITELEATPASIASAEDSSGRVVQSKGTIENTPATGDTIQLARVPVDATLVSLRFANDDFGTDAPANIGFYRVGAPGTVIDLDSLCTLLVFETATAMTEYRFETQAIETISEKMWELANLAAKPTYPQADIVLTWGTIDTGQAGTLSWYIEYTL